MQIWSEYVLYILLVETIPTSFCWLECRKRKLVQNGTLQQELNDLIPWWFDKFRQVFVHFLMSILMMCKKTGGYIFLVSLRGIPLRGDLVHKKNRPEKYPFIATNNWIVFGISSYFTDLIEIKLATVRS